MCLKNSLFLNKHSEFVMISSMSFSVSPFLNSSRTYPPPVLYAHLFLYFGSLFLSICPPPPPEQREIRRGIGLVVCVLSIFRGGWFMCGLTMRLVYTE
jgi:hypothetical protein